MRPLFGGIMNWYGGGFIPIIIYQAYAEGAVIEEIALLTEDSQNILTEDGQEILVDQ